MDHLVALAAPQAERKPFTLSPFQQGIFWDDRRFIVGASGRGCGKSSAVVCTLIGKIQRGEVPAGSRILVFGPSYPQMRQGTIKTFDKFFDQTGLVLKKIDGNEPERRLRDDIVVYFRNASNPEQTRSHETTFVWLDEYGQMRDDVLTLCNAAQRQWGSDFNYQTYITSTPRGKNHFYRRFKERIDSHDRFMHTNCDMASLKSRISARNRWNTGEENEESVAFYRTTTLEAQAQGIDLPESYVEDMGYAEGSQGWQQEIEGDFVTWAGLVFDRFDPRKHCPDPFTPPPFARVYGGIDVGYGGITSMLLTGVTSGGGMYTFKEYYQRRADPHDWMKLAGEWTRQHNVKKWFIDAAADKEYGAMKQNLPVYRSMKAKDAAGSAVGFINSKFARNELFIDRSACPFLISEMETYQYKELVGEQDNTFLEKTKPNQPDHAIDAWRYHILPLSSAMVQYGQSVEFAIA